MRDSNFIGKFFTAYNMVIEKTLPHLAANEKLLLLTLINGSWLKGQDYVWASLSELRQSSGLAENTIKKTLKGLIQKNLIRVSARETSKTSRSYSIFWPENKGAKIPNSVWTLPGSPATDSNNPSNYIYPRLDPDDKEAFNIILKGLSQSEIHDYEEQARDYFKENGLSVPEEEVLWHRNDLIFRGGMGPLRVEKYL